jgi:hypothetical protein
MLTKTAYGMLLGRFAASLADDAIAAQGVTAASRERIDIYRNNVRTNRVTALADAFANVVQLVGVDYFRELARVYVDCTPANSANLHDDGAGLPAFIRGFAPVADLPYLSDVAQVDWLLHRAYFAADSHAIDASKLGELGAERFAAASIRFAPSVALARSDRWPIADILQMHADGTPAQLGAGGQAVLVWRQGFAVRWQALAPTDADTIAALMSGRSIEDAFSQTHADASSLLAQLFSHRLVLAIEERS